jgi:hypothetical protein
MEAMETVTVNKGFLQLVSLDLALWDFGIDMPDDGLSTGRNM